MGNIPDNIASVGIGLGGAAITGLAWVAREWWKQRGAQRADAVDSANAKAQVGMLEDARKERQEERERRIAAEARIDALIEQQAQMRSAFIDQREALTAQLGLLTNKYDLSERKLRMSLATMNREDAAAIETGVAPLGDK